MSPLRWGVRGFGLFVAMTLVVSFVLMVVIPTDWPRPGVAPILSTLAGVVFVTLLVMISTGLPSAAAIFVVYLLGRRFGASRVVLLGPAMLLLAIVPLVMTERSFRVATTLVAFCLGQILVGLFLSRSFPTY